MYKIVYFLFIAFLLQLSSFVQAEEFQYNYNVINEESSFDDFLIKKNEKITMPEGIYLRGILQNTISTKSSKIGDVVTLIIPSNIVFNGYTIIPKDSIVEGKVITLKPPVQGRDGSFQILFSDILLSNQDRIKIIAHAIEKNKSGVIGGSQSKRASFKKVPHYVENIGGYIKLVPDGPRVMGKDKILKAGNELNFVLDKKIEIDIINYEEY